MASPKHNRRIEAEHAELTKQVADLRKQLEDSKGQDQDEDTQDNAYRSRKPSASAAEKDKEVAKLKEVRAEDYEKIAQLEADMEAKTADYQKLDQELQEAKEYADNLQFDLDGMHTLHEEWNEEKKTLEVKLKNLEVTVQEELRTTHQQKQALSDMLRQMGDAAAEKNQMLDEIREYGIENITLKANLQDREEELTRIAIEIEPMQEERNQLIEIRTIFSGFFEANLDFNPTSLPEIIRRFMREGTQAQDNGRSFRPKTSRRVSSLADEFPGESDDDDFDAGGDDDNEEDDRLFGSDQQDGNEDSNQPDGNEDADQQDENEDSTQQNGNEVADQQDENEGADQQDGNEGADQQDGNEDSSRAEESHEGGSWHTFDDEDDVDDNNGDGDNEETSEQQAAPAPAPAPPAPAPPGQAPPVPAPPGQAAPGTAPPGQALPGQAPPGQAPSGQQQAVRPIRPRNYGELQWWQILLLIFIGIIIGHTAHKDESKVWLAANDATRQRVVSSISPNAWMMEKNALGG